MQCRVVSLKWNDFSEVRTASIIRAIPEDSNLILNAMRTWNFTNEAGSAISELYSRLIILEKFKETNMQISHSKGELGQYFQCE
jgi:hypothetical protein